MRRITEPVQSARGGIDWEARRLLRRVADLVRSWGQLRELVDTVAQNGTDFCTRFAKNVAQTRQEFVKRKYLVLLKL
jgi:hypothetical protein